MLFSWGQNEPIMVALYLLKVLKILNWKKHSVTDHPVGSIASLYKNDKVVPLKKWFKLGILLNVDVMHANRNMITD